jgi:hypothetical protein
MKKSYNVTFGGSMIANASLQSVFNITGINYFSITKLVYTMHAEIQATSIPINLLTDSTIQKKVEFSGLGSGDIKTNLFDNFSNIIDVLSQGDYFQFIDCGEYNFSENCIRCSPATQLVHNIRNKNVAAINWYATIYMEVIY